MNEQKRSWNFVNAFIKNCNGKHRRNVKNAWAFSYLRNRHVLIVYIRGHMIWWEICRCCRWMIFRCWTSDQFAGIRNRCFTFEAQFFNSFRCFCFRLDDIFLKLLENELYWNLYFLAASKHLRLVSNFRWIRTTRNNCCDCVSMCNMDLIKNKSHQKYPEQ